MGELERKMSEGLRDRACEEGRGRQIGAPKLKLRLEAEAKPGADREPNPIKDLGDGTLAYRHMQEKESQYRTTTNIISPSIATGSGKDRVFVNNSILLCACRPRS